MKERNIKLREHTSAGIRFLKVAPALFILLLFTPIHTDIIGQSQHSDVTIEIHLPNDTIPPRSITDITASVKEIVDDYGSVKLQWTAPADIDFSGSERDVFSYIIRFATFSVACLNNDTTAWWNHPHVITALTENIDFNWPTTVKSIIHEYNQPNEEPDWGILAGKPRQEKEIVIITGLSLGHWYWFCIRSRDSRFNLSDFDEGTKGLVTQTSVYIVLPPEKVLDLVATPTRAREVTLTWTTEGKNWYLYSDRGGKYAILYTSITAKHPAELGITKPDDPEQYKLYSPTFTAIIFSTTTTPNKKESRVITGLQPEVSYYFYLWGKNEAGWSAPSNQAVAFVRLAGPPSPVSQLTYQILASTDPEKGTYIKFTWTNPPESDFEYIEIISTNTYWDIERKIKLSGLSPKKSVTWYDYQLYPRQTYYYTIQTFAIDETPSPEKIYISTYTAPDILAPAPPAELIVLTSILKDVQRVNVSLTWTHPSPSVYLKEYRNIDFARSMLCYSSFTYPTTPSQGVVLSSVNYPTGTFIHENLLFELTHYYSIFMIDEVGNYSFLSTKVVQPDIVPPSAPTEFKVVLTSGSVSSEVGSYVRLSWINPQEPDFIKVKIYYSTDSKLPRDKWNIKESPGVRNVEQSYDLVRLYPRVTYYIELTAFDRAGNESLPTPGITVVYTAFDYLPPQPPRIEFINVSSDDFNTGLAYEIKFTPPDLALYENYDYHGFKFIFTTSPIAGPINKYLTRETTSFEFVQLLPYTSYYIYYVSFDDAPKPNYSVIISTVIFVTPPKWLIDTISPFTPVISNLQLEKDKIEVNYFSLPYNKDRTGFKGFVGKYPSEFYRYIIQRSTDILGPYTTVEITTSTKYEIPLLHTTYYYSITSIDVSNNWSGCLYIIEAKSEPEIYAVDENLISILKITPQFKKDNTKIIQVTTNRSNLPNSIFETEITAFDYTLQEKPLTFVTPLELTYKITKQEAEKMLPLKPVVFWHDGLRWITLPTNSTQVKTQARGGEIMNFSALIHAVGRYLLGYLMMASEFTTPIVEPRLITPNNDGYNDVVFFEFDNPNASVVKTTIYDIRGAVVKVLPDYSYTKSVRTNKDTVLKWDGKDTEGETVQPGVYIWRIEVDDGGKKKVFNGTIIVAR